MVKTEKKYDIEASLSTATVILILLLLLSLIRLAVPDPPLNERGPRGGDGGYGLELTYAPVVSEPSVIPNTQQEAEQTVLETLLEETTEDTPAEDPVISDNSSENVIKVAEKKSEKKTKQVQKESGKLTETSDKPIPKKKNPEVKVDDLFNEYNNNGGGDPNGNEKGSIGDNKGTSNVGVDGNVIDVKSRGFSNWNYSPPKNKTSTTTGEIEFEIEIDDKGIVKNVTKKRSTVSIEIVNAYIQDIFKMQFTKKSDGTISNNSTKGTLTYSFKAR